jgi:hypothetical protein
VQGSDGLLVDGFDRDRMDLLVARGLEQGFGVGAIGLGAVAVTADLGRR